MWIEVPGIATFNIFTTFNQFIEAAEVASQAIEISDIFPSACLFFCSVFLVSGSTWQRNALSCTSRMHFHE